MKRLRWYRWSAVIVGEESGNVSPVPFIRFRHWVDGLRWIDKMNARPGRMSTHFELRPIR